MEQTRTASQRFQGGALRMLSIAMVGALSLCGSAYAQSASGTFGVTVLLRTFSETVTSDHRCTHRGQADKETVRISCPATVDIQAVSNAAAGWTMQHQRLNGAETYRDRYHVTSAAGVLPTSSVPIELTISW